MNVINQKRLQAALDSTERVILAYSPPDDPDRVAILTKEAIETLEVYAKNLYISFFLKELQKKDDITNDALVTGILDYFANSLDLLGEPPKYFFTGLSDEIKRYKPRFLGNSQSCKTAEAILHRLPDSIKNSFADSNRVHWNLLVEAFEPTEDPIHPDYPRNSIKSARSFG